MAHEIDATAQVALECISNSDALYHNLEHTMLVTLVGRDILRGRALTEPTTPSDWAHFLIACLMHDIGYVRSIIRGDDGNQFTVDTEGRRVVLPRGASDAALAPYHVDRSKLFVMERLGASASPATPITCARPMPCFTNLRRSASRRGSAIVRRLTWLSATRTSSGRTCQTISLQPSAT